MACSSKFLASVCELIHPHSQKSSSMSILTSRQLVCCEHGHRHHCYSAGEPAIPIPRVALYRLLHIRFERFPVHSLSFSDDSSIYDVAREIYADDQSSCPIFVHRNFSYGSSDNRQPGRLYLRTSMG